jgi:hypothetical protein
MRVYHFLNKKLGMHAIPQRRLKISRWKSLNDPFEMLALNIRDREIRAAMNAVLDKADGDSGLICYSTDWRNPVQWAHYAASHTGICLGLDVPPHLVRKIRYRSKRIPDQALIDAVQREDQDAIADIMFTKYAHWKYEKQDCVVATIFPPWGPRFVLK